jgi:hypothetical protein
MTNAAYLSELFAQWRQSYPQIQAAHFVTDGPINPPNYESAALRILFVLKEAHDRNGVMGACGYDLPTFWRDTKSFRQKRDIVGTRLDGWAGDLYVRTGHKRPLPREAFLASAVMNLKKLAGGAKANPKEIKEAVKSDQQYILRQLEILNPKIIVCGGTLCYLRPILKDFMQVNSAKFTYSWCDKLIMDHHHPSYPAANRLRNRHTTILNEFTKP